MTTIPKLTKEEFISGSYEEWKPEEIMTVADLKKKLDNFDDDLIVMGYDRTGGFGVISTHSCVEMLIFHEEDLLEDRRVLLIEPYN